MVLHVTITETLVRTVSVEVPAGVKTEEALAMVEKRYLEGEDDDLSLTHEDYDGSYTAEMTEGVVKAQYSIRNGTLINIDE